MKPTPVIRKEMYLNAMGAGGTIPVPSPYPRIEKYLYRLDGFDDKDIPSPENRIERYLYWLCGYRDKWIDTPVTRIEKYMYYACGGEGYGYPTPVTREEQFWYDYIQAYIEVKTLTGTLPLTFTTSETALRSWTIYGNNYEHTYSAEGTLPLTFTSHTAGNASDWSISGNDKVGKNLVDFMAGEPAQGVTINEFDAQTGSMVISSATRYRGVTIYFNFQDGKTYTVSAYNNIATSNARITLRSIGQNTIIYSSSLVSTGQKTITFTYSAIDYPSGLYISLIPNMSDDGQIHTISLSNLMLVEGSTTPSTFEPYQIGVGQLVDDHFEIPVYSYPSNIPQIKKDLIGAKVHETQVTMRKGNETLVWDVIGIDHDEVYYQDGTRAQHSVTLQMHDVYTSLQFSARQALFTFPYGCPVGTYHFIVVDQPWYTSDQNKSMQFTLTKAIPEGGQLVINNAYNATMIGATISSYASPSTTTALESVTMSQGTGGTNLGDVAIATNGNTNSVQRALLGSNNYQYSAMRQWLNSNGAAGSVWTPQTPFDRPPSWASNTAGFLNGIDTDIQALIGECDKITALNTITDGGGSWTSREKVFLLSKTEVYGGNENSIAEGVAYPYYSDYSDLSAAGMAADANRTKYRNGSEQVWWVRSPNTSSAYSESDIRILGSINSNTTNNTYGAAPAIVIPMDEIHNYHFNIGDTPLTAGQSISKTSTGVDIAAIAGSNTITTELYNKPEMAIEGVDYVGVGEYVNGQWQIPLSVTCDRNLFNIHGNMARSGGIQPIDFNVETSSVTGEMSADSHYILGYANAIVKGDETFVISFDKTTAGTAEMRMMNGTGSSAEIIETFDISAAKSYRVVFECKESFGNVYPWLVATEAATNTFEHIMIKKASDKGGFVPYGAHTDYTIPIDAPLTEGQSVTDTLTINTFEGENTIDTTMANKPNMSITYKGG